MDTPLETLDLSDLSGQTDGNLAALIEAAQDEQKRRAIEAGDLEAIIEDAFEQGFTAKGMARGPWLTDDGILVCPGSIIEKSTQSHVCSFVNLDDTWAWQAQDLLLDEVRKIPAQARTHQRSVSLIAAYDGLEFTVVVCKARNSVHEMQSSTTYTVHNGSLEVVSSRTPKVSNHR